MRGVIKVTKGILILLGTILSVTAMVLATVIYFSIQWMFNTWSNLTMDELVYHLTAPLEGTNEDMIREYLNICVAPAVLVLIVAVILFLSWHNKKRYYVLMAGGIIVSLVLSTKVIQGAWNELDAGGYVEAKGEYSTFIDVNYADPAEVVLQFPEKKRNLV